MSAKTHPFTFIDPRCGRPAFHRVAIPVPTDPVRAADCEHIDGRPTQETEAFACDSCGCIFELHDLLKMTQHEHWKQRNTDIDQ